MYDIPRVDVVCPVMCGIPVIDVIAALLSKTMDLYLTVIVCKKLN